MSLEKYKEQFEEHGVKAEHIDTLSEDYDDLEELSAASFDELTEYDGIGEATAKKILAATDKILEGEEAEDADKPSSSLSTRKLFSRPASRAELEEAERNTTVEGSDREFIMIEQVVDKFYTKRYRVEKTETTCEECGYDVLRSNRIKESYKDLSSSDKKAVEKTLQEHKLLFHSVPSHRRVISGKEMSQTNWTNPQSTRQNPVIRQDVE